MIFDGLIPADHLTLMGRVAFAGACGALVGAERELSEKPAGLRTHTLVALGAAAFTASGFGALGAGATDVLRIPAQIVPGVGFLGGGIVIFHGDRLRGLTTAAEIWTTAAIGILAGLGALVIAGASTLIMLLVVVGGKPVERLLERERRQNLFKRRRARLARGEPPDPDDELDAEAELDPSDS